MILDLREHLFSVLVVSASEKFNSSIAEFIPKSRFTPVTYADNIAAAKRVLIDNSFDIVFTHHAIEPNGGKEKQILSELYRVANKYLILVEPAYDLVDNDKIRRRMEEHGYIKNLYGSAKELGLNVITWQLYGNCISELNPPGLMIIKKK